MSVEISEARPDEFESVLSFCGLGAETDVLETRPFLSLTAKDGGQLVGALVCTPHSESDATTQTTVRGKDADHDLTAKLLGMALGKLYAMGVRQCRIALHQPSQETDADDSACSFWVSAIWSDRPDLAGAQHVLRVMGRPSRNVACLQHEQC